MLSWPKTIGGAGMRRRTFFDESIFLVSFSVALGVLSLIIPAQGASVIDPDAAQMPEYIDLCDTGSDAPDCVAAVGFGDADEKSVDAPAVD
jgi:hypothetical protein